MQQRVRTFKRVLLDEAMNLDESSEWQPAGRHGVHGFTAFSSGHGLETVCELVRDQEEDQDAR